MRLQIRNKELNHSTTGNKSLMFVVVDLAPYPYKFHRGDLC